MAPGKRVRQFTPSVFAEFSRLAQAHGAVNLGQGFPDFEGPLQIRAAAAHALEAGQNQYAMSAGTPVLREAVAAHAQRFYGQRVDPAREVVVTCGATEAIFDAVQAFVEPGDEVVLFEPFYDSYLASVAMARGVPRFVQLHAPDDLHPRWWFDDAALTAAFSDRTALVIVNTPHNPTGKVFTADELARIGALAKQRGAVLLTDEVYEHLVFPGASHVRAATLPGLGDHTVTISSGGKSFSFTGWKVGWAIGPAELIGAIQNAHQWVSFCTPAPFQAAIAQALALPDEYFRGFVADYQAKRDFLAQALSEAGLTPLPCEGTYFLMAKTDGLRQAGEDDVAFCRRLVADVKVAAIPPSSFYGQAHASAAHGLARFAFCKTQPVLDEARRRLARRG